MEVGMSCTCANIKLKRHKNSDLSSLSFQLELPMSDLNEKSTEPSRCATLTKKSFIRETWKQSG